MKIWDDALIMLKEKGGKKEIRIISLLPTGG